MFINRHAPPPLQAYPYTPVYSATTTSPLARKRGQSSYDEPSAKRTHWTASSPPRQVPKLPPKPSPRIPQPTTIPRISLKRTHSDEIDSTLEQLSLTDNPPQPPLKRTCSSKEPTFITSQALIPFSFHKQTPPTQMPPPFHHTDNPFTMDGVEQWVYHTASTPSSSTDDGDEDRSDGGSLVDLANGFERLGTKTVPGARTPPYGQVVLYRPFGIVVEPGDEKEEEEVEVGFDGKGCKIEEVEEDEEEEVASMELD
ncbi:hypothetical protein HDU99_007359 [Rhizoclosmatium hyalinum]|nr:hypothetical protein HDU99_007359 [Rhizoclosmatium hyalinum]